MQRVWEGECVEEKIKDVLDAYTFQTTRVCRGRGAFICDTDQGMKIVKAYHRSPQRLEFEQLVKYTIRDRGYYYVDQLLPNKEGYLSQSRQDGKFQETHDHAMSRIKSMIPFVNRPADKKG